ncbi:MAG: TatD family deoxyribonuclease [Ruminococcaceae bacterium]|nr:TatD family deoxyribonuclease [Oscillospiraceae bacterium]
MLFDTHSHLDDEKFDNDRDELIARIHNEFDVDLIMVVGADIESSKRAIELAEKYDFIYASVGVHPHDTESMSEDDIDTLRDMCAHKKVKAVGEIGLDYYYDNSPRDIQKKWFARQMQLAREVNLPVIIHDRDAHADCMEILKREGVDITGGVFHCFSGSAQMAKEALKMGMYISFAGPLTYKNAVKTVEVASVVPIERIFVETDSPYLAPVPHRGERNHPGYVADTARKLAEIKGMSFEEVAKITRQNATRFFKIEL